MLSTSDSRRVQSVETGFAVIRVIQNQDGATLNELADHLDIAKSTAHNYVQTLESMGYVVKKGGTYRLGLRFLTHGMAAKNAIGMRDVITDALAEVADEIAHVLWWITEEYGRGIFVESASSNDTQQIYGRLGKRSYLHTSGPGKAILAEFPDEYIQKVIDYHGLPVLTTKTVTDSEVLFEQLTQIREQGYAFANGEAALGVQSVGVAFTDPNDRTHAIGVFGYSHDFGGETLDEEIPSLLDETIEDIIETLTERSQ